MPFASIRPLGRQTVVASLFALAASAMPALADPRAPITYAYGPAAAEKPSEAGVDKASQRIEFRYPGSATATTRTEPAPAPAKPPAAPSAPRLLVQSAPLQPMAELRTSKPADSAEAGTAISGLVIVYGDEFNGLPTSNGEIFDQSALTAAHPSLPLPSLVAVRNPSTGREVTVRVNDRGPFEDDAMLQVSREAARQLGIDGAGQGVLSLRVLGPAGASAATGPSPISLKPAAALQAASGDELLGGDELAGGPAAKPARAPVAWPEPPAELGVSPPATKVAAEPGTHFVQLASFSDINNAEALYRGLRADLPVEIVPARVNGSDYFRVRVGPMDSRASAEALRDRLDSLGKGDGRVVSAQ